VPAPEVIARAAELRAILFDVPDVEHTHYGDECTFDYFIGKHALKDPALLQLVIILLAAAIDILLKTVISR
jgi:hypothetical protein